MNNFTDAPISISELRSDKSGNAKDWTPRDALIALLRDIDSGKQDVDHAIICYRVRLKDGEYDPATETNTDTRFSQAGGSNWAWDALGLLERVKYLINSKRYA